MIGKSLRPILFASTSVEFELFAPRLTDPKTQNVRMLYFGVRPNLDLTCDLNLKILSKDMYQSTSTFGRHLPRLATTPSFRDNRVVIPPPPPSSAETSVNAELTSQCWVNQSMLG